MEIVRVNPEPDEHKHLNVPCDICIFKEVCNPLKYEQWIVPNFGRCVDDKHFELRGGAVDGT